MIFTLSSPQAFAASESETSELISSLNARHKEELHALERKLDFDAAAYNEELERLRSDAVQSSQITTDKLMATVAEAQAASESAHAAAAAAASQRVSILEVELSRALKLSADKGVCAHRILHFDWCVAVFHCLIVSPIRNFVFFLPCAQMLW